MLIPVQKSDNGHQQFDVAADGIVNWSVPEFARSARILIEKDSTSTQKTIARFRLDGGDPTSSVGFPVVDGQPITIGLISELNNFKMVSAEAGKTPRIIVQFYTADLDEPMFGVASATDGYTAESGSGGGSGGSGAA